MSLSDEILRKIIRFVLNDCFDALFEAIFSDEDNIDYEKIIELMREFYEKDIDSFGVDDKQNIEIYFSYLRENEAEKEYLVYLIEDEMSQSDSIPKKWAGAIEKNKFWTLYSVACKKCIGNPTAIIEDRNAYYNRVDISNNEKKKAHDCCLNGFNMNSDNFKRSENKDLKIFLPSLRNTKKNKIRKKHIHQVERRARKIMQMHKLFNLKSGNNIFKGHTEIVSKQFVKVVVEDFIV